MDITSQPLNQTVTAGNAVTLSVTATGSGLTYQWHLGTSGNTNAPVLGATGPAYTTPALTTNVNYWVVVRNAFGLVDSATASLSVQPVTGAATLGLNMLAGLTIDGTAGGAYRLEYTTNAASTNWVALTNFTLLALQSNGAQGDELHALRRVEQPRGVLVMEEQARHDGRGGFRSPVPARVFETLPGFEQQLV
ncbi:MAG: hypothetical protein RL514_4647 [Verrucomicrobiota bacterium]|jgi:hypothetical protein